jgi:hypothetical protein
MRSQAKWVQVGLIGMLTAGLLALAPHAARAHCDTMDGPVVVDAQAALAKGDVTRVLKWIHDDQEDAIRAAFTKTLKVRTQGEDARELADLWFFETVVRLHRAGEGAPYTGLKPAGTPVPEPIVRADRALQKNNLDNLAERVGQHAAAGVRERFQRAAETKKHMNDSVEAGREYVKAYVTYIHYVENLHNAIEGHDAHGGEGTGQADAHAEE